MVCPKCGSEDGNVQVVTETKLIEKHHGIFWWVFIGWWRLFFKWVFLTLPALIVKLFSSKKYKAKTTQHSVCVCQSCGHRWEV